MDRKTDFCNTDKAIVTVYNIAEDFDGLIWKCFEEDIAEWIDFISQRAVNQLLCYESYYEAAYE